MFSRLSKFPIKRFAMIKAVPKISRNITTHSMRNNTNISTFCLFGGVLLGFGSCWYFNRGNAVSLNDIKDNCDDPVCHDTMSNFFNINSQISENKTNKESKSSENLPYHSHEDCPPDRRKLGHDSWTLLHTMAVYYNPTSENQEYLLNFLVSLSHLYPCKLCAMHMRLYMRENPPELSSQESYVVWLSKFHNEISRYIGNKEYPEDYDWNMKRWKYGLPHCQNNENNGNKSEVSSEESINCEDVSLLEITKNVLKNKLK